MKLELFVPFLLVFVSCISAAPPHPPQDDPDPHVDPEVGEGEVNLPDPEAEVPEVDGGDVQARRGHSVHSSYKKEIPYDYEKPQEETYEPVEVEVFDPYDPPAPADPEPFDEGEAEGAGEYKEDAEVFEYNNSPTTTDVYYQPPPTFTSSFDKILRSAEEYRASVTQPLQLLAEDVTGRRAKETCILQRTRVILTLAMKKFLQSYSHWAKLGTSLEESHCRQDAKSALVAFSVETDKVSRDLHTMQDIDVDSFLDTPKAKFKALEDVVVSTMVMLGPVLGTGNVEIPNDYYGRHPH